MSAVSRKRIVLAGLLLVILPGMAALIPAQVWAMPPAQFSPTPVQVVLPTISPTVFQETTATPTRTPTPAGPALVEALEGATNVRANPDISADRVGQIFPGETYPVLGQGAGYGGTWYRIQYADSPNGTAWVFAEVVTVTGDVDDIPEITISTEPTIDVGAVVGTQTVEALALTPGALETATVDAFLFGGVVATDSGATVMPSPTRGPLPTFTYPPESAGVQVTAGTTNVVQQTLDQGSGLPPVLPILALGALGGLGMLIGLLRRIN
jgi:hypothetical protein